MKKVLAILMLLCTPAAAQNYLRDDGIFHSVVEGTTTGQLLQNQSGLLGGISLPLPLVIGTTPITGTPLTGVLYNNSGFLDASSVFTFTPTAGVTLAPAAASNNLALTITQSTPSSSSVAGPLSGNLISYTGNAQTVTGTGLDSFGQIKNTASVFRVNLTVTGGANYFGGNFAANITATNGGVVPLLSSCYVNVGTITGDCWANIAVGNVGPSGNLNQSLIGYEAEMLVASTGVVKDRIGFSANSQGPTVGTNIDAAIVASTINLGITGYLTAAPWVNFIHLSTSLYASSTFPVSGSVILADTGTVTNFISAPTLTVSGNILGFLNLKVSGTGGAILGAAATAPPAGGLRISYNNVGAIIVSPNPDGVTNPTFSVDSAASTATNGNGVYVFSTAAGSGANITTVSSTTNEPLKLNAKGSGTIDLAGTSTGGVTVHGSFTATGLVTSADLNADVFSTAHSWGGIQTLTTPVFTGLPTGTGVATTNTVSTLVARDGSGNFSAGTITAALSGNATTATTATSATTATNATNGATVATSTNASFFPLFAASSSNSNQPFNLDTTFTYNPSTDTLTATTFIGALTGHGSLDLALTGGTMSGAIAMGANAITGIQSLSASGATTFSTNNGTLAGTITTGQKWGLGPETNPQYRFVASNNTATGITISPTVALFVDADGTSSNFFVATFGTSVNSGFFGTAARGTAASPTQTKANDVEVFFGGRGLTSTAATYTAATGLAIFAAEDQVNSTNGGTYAQVLLSAAGSTARDRITTFQASGGLSIGGQMLAAPANDPGNGGIYATGATIKFTALANVATTSALCYNTGTGLLTYDGTIGTCTVSDERLKNMGERIPDALARLLKINGVYYTWKDPASMGNGRQIGVGAQTVEAVFPELVQSDSSGYKSADYQRLTAPIIEAMRELKADNDNLSAEVQSLKRGTR